MDIVHGLRRVKRTVASLSLATLIASLFAIGVAQAQTFPDVNPSDWFYSYVEDLVSLGVVNSSMPEYRPGDNVNRAEMAKLVVEAFSIDLVSPDEPTFKDVAKGTWYYEYVETAAAHGIVGGYKDTEGTFTGYYGPADAVTREQSAKMIVLGAPLEVNTNCGPSFPDVPLNRWSYEYVETLYVNSVVDGYPDGTFGAENQINRAEIAKIVSNGMAPMLRPCGGFSVVSADALSATTVEVCFTQDYDETSAMMPENYAIEDGNGDALAVSAVEATSDPSCVLLTTDAQDSTSVYDLMVTDVMNVDSMELLSGTATFNGYTVGTTGALTVDLDGSTPDSVSIPQNGANILYSVFGFSASDDEALNVESLVVTREGLGLPGDFRNIKLYVDGVQVGSEKTVNTTTNSATFNLTNDPIMVPAGSRVLVEVRADMNGVSGSENQLCIVSPDDVLTYGEGTGEEVSVGGDFAICGEKMNTTSASVGTLNYTVTQSSTSAINVGDVDVSFTKVKMDETVEDVNVTRMTFKQGGSADAEVFGNLHLMSSGSPLDATMSWSGDYVTFDLSENPIFIAKGNSKTVELWGDVTGGLNTTAQFDIYRDWHIEGTGTVYGYGVNVLEVGGVTPTARNIIGGNVAFSLSSNNPVTGEVKVGANDYEFTRFNVSTGGDGVTVRKISLTVAGTDFNDIDDVKIWGQNSAGDWVVLAGPNDILAVLPQTVAFTDTFDIPAATTTEFIVTADIANVATLGDVYDIDVTSVNLAANTELEYLSDGTSVDVTTDVTGGTLNGNVMTVDVPTLAVTTSATPGAKSYVRNTNDKDIVAFDLNASTADDVRVTGLTVNCAPAGAGNCSTAFATIKLYEKVGSTLTLVDNQARSMTGTTVTFSTNYVIPAGSTARLLVRANLQSGAVADTYNWNITNPSTLVSAEDTDSNVVTVTPAVPTVVNAITVAANGNVTNQGVSDASLQARFVAGLSTDQPLLKLKFSADELEAWYVKKLRFNLLSGTDSDIVRLKVTYLDNTGTQQTATGTVSGGIVQFSGLNIYVAAGESQTVDVSLDMGNVTTGGAVAGDIVQVCMNADDAAGTGCPIGVTAPNVVIYEAIGASSATLVQDAGIDVSSNVLRLAKSFPVVTSNDNVSTTMTTNSTLYSVTIAANSAGPIAVKQLCFDVVNGGGGAYTAASAKLYRDGESTDLVTAGQVTITEGALCGATGTGVLVQWLAGGTGGEDQIAAGTSKTYVLKGAVTGAAAIDKVTTTLIGDNTGAISQGVVAAVAPYTVGGNAEWFVWSDLSKSPHLSNEVVATSTDFLDGYLVDGLSNLNAHEVKFN